MRSRSLLVPVLAALLATVVAKDTAFKDGSLQHRTLENDTDKNFSSVATGIPFPSTPIFSKDETSSFAKEQLVTTPSGSSNDKVTFSPGRDQSPTSLPSKDDKLPSVPAKDQPTITPSVSKDDKDKDKISASSSAVDKTTSVPNKDKTSASVEAKDDKSTSVDVLDAFLNYVYTKDKDKKPSSTLPQGLVSTFVQTSNETLTSAPSKDETQSPAVIVYSVSIPAIPTPNANSSGALLFAPSNVLISGITFPGYKIVPSPTKGPLKADKSEISTANIPVWTPALLGNAYGGGVIPTPTIYVVRQSLPNGPPTGVPPGYGGSSPQTISPISKINGTSPTSSSPKIEASGSPAKSVSTLGTGQVKVEGNLPIVHYVTETVLTTTTYCPVTTISGKPYTLSSTTLTKTFATISVLPITQAAGNGPALGHSNVSAVVGHGPFSTIESSGITASKIGKLPPVPSKEAGISQGRFTNTSTEIIPTPSQTIPGLETLSNPNSATLRPTVPAVTQSLISELSSLFASSGTHVPVTVVPVSLVSQLVSVFGSSEASTPTAATALNFSPGPTSSSPAEAPGSQTEIKPIIPVSLVSELSSLLSSSGVQTQTAAVIPAAVVSKVASILIGSGNSTAVATSNSPGLLSEADKESTASALLPELTVPGGVGASGSFSVNGAPVLGAGTSIEAFISASATPTGPGAPPTIGSLVITLETPQLGSQIPVEGSGISTVVSPKVSVAVSPETTILPHLTSSLAAKINSASVSATLSPLVAIVASQPSGPSSTPEKASGAIVTPANVGSEPQLSVGFAVSAGASAPQGGTPSTETPTVLAATPELAGTSSPSAPASPGSAPKQSSAAFGGNVPVPNSPGSSPEQSSLGVIGLQSEISLISLAANPSGATEASEAAGTSNAQALTPLGSTPKRSSAELGGPGLSNPSATISPSFAPTISSEASGAAGVSSSLVGSPVLLALTSASSLESAGSISPVTSIPAVLPHGESPAVPIALTSTQATFSTGVTGNSNAGGNGSVSLLLNPTAALPFLGAGVKMPPTFGLGISALLSLFLV